MKWDLCFIDWKYNRQLTLGTSALLCLTWKSCVTPWDVGSSWQSAFHTRDMDLGLWSGQTLCESRGSTSCPSCNHRTCSCTCEERKLWQRNLFFRNAHLRLEVDVGSSATWMNRWKSFNQVFARETNLLALLVGEGEEVGGEAGGGDPALHQVARAQQVVHAHVQPHQIKTPFSAAADLGLLYNRSPSKWPAEERSYSKPAASTLAAQMGFDPYTRIYSHCQCPFRES